MLRTETGKQPQVQELLQQADYLAYEIDQLRENKLLSESDKRANAAALQEELRLLREQLQQLEDV